MEYNIALIVCLLLVVLLIRQVYQAFLGPLSNLPGPLISRFTSLKYEIACLYGVGHFYIDSLHNDYGSIVRVTPNLVVVSDSKMAKEIHKVPTAFPKSKWYDDLTGDMNAMFGMRNVAEHAARRRMLGYQMSESYLKLMEPRVRSKVDTAVVKMTADAKRDGYVDVWRWTYALNMDTMTDLSFGEPVGMLKDGNKPAFVSDFESLVPQLIPKATMPWLFGPLSMIPGLLSSRDSKAAVDRVMTHTHEVYKRYKAFVISDYDKASETPTLFTKMLNAKDNKFISEGDLLSEMTDYISAGADTVTSTIGSLVWAMAKRPDLQARMAEEIERLGDFDNQALKDSRFLDNLIHETLRLFGAGNGMFPRDVPADGTQMGPYFLKDVTIGCHPYTMHRNANVFPQPLDFDPDRWEKPTQAMKDNLMPWGGGARACIGMNLAMMEMRLIIAVFYRAFPKTSICPKANPRDMEESRSFSVIYPVGYKTLIQIDEMAE